MRAILFAVPLALLPAVAMAQDTSTAAQIFAAQHQVAVCQSDDSAVLARAYDLESALMAAQKTIADLKAKATPAKEK